MIKYVVFWDKNEIGRIYKKSENEDNYKYVPNYTEIEKTSAPMTIYGKTYDTWGPLPEFFADRISKDPKCENSCKCATDKLTIKMVKP